MIYAVAALALAAIAMAVYFGRTAFKAKDQTMAATDRMHAEAKLAAEEEAALVMERDALSQKLDVATAQLAAAKVRLASAEAQRNTAHRDERAHVAEEIRTAPVADAARLGNRILSRPLPRLPKADPAAPGDGDRKADAVPAAGPAKPAP